MASAGINGEKYGGYEECFLETVPDRLVCSICTKVQRDPHLMVCCGQKYCSSCLQSWLNLQKVEQCPHCRATKGGSYIVLHILDKGVKSEIESMFILCTHYKKGCEWVGELRSSPSHLKDCGYVPVECPNRCSSGGEILRKNLQSHVNRECKLRKMRCPHCGHVGRVKDQPRHEEVCSVLHPPSPKSSKQRSQCTIS